MKNNFKK